MTKVMILSNRDRKRLEGVDRRLVRVVEKAAEITEVPFLVSEGLRSYERQKMLYDMGKSKTMNSKHLTGKAVDLYPLTDDRKMINSGGYDRLARAMKKAAFELFIEIEWGGDWKQFIDKPHYQLKD